MKLNPYLHLNGQCEAAFKFYEKTLGAKILMMLRYDDSPTAGECTPVEKDKIMHARLSLGDDIIMASDAPEGRSQDQSGFSLNISVDTPEEAERIYQALSEKGKVCMPLAETFWALRFAMFIDQFGVPWMINCEKKA